MVEEIIYVERKRKPGRMQEKYEDVMRFLRTDVCSMKVNLKEVIHKYTMYELLALVHPTHREYHGKKLLDLGKISESYYRSLLRWG